MAIAAGCFAIAVQVRAAQYVPGMTCVQVGDFAQTVADYRKSNESMRDQLADLRNSLPKHGYERAIHAMSLIIRAIYTESRLAAATPAQVNAAYRKACEAVQRSG